MVNAIVSGDGAAVARELLRVPAAIKSDGASVAGSVIANADGSTAAGFHHLAAGVRKLGLVLAQTCVHLRRLADMLGA